MTGISREGPYPVIHVLKKTYHPGAAGNAAAQICALGSRAMLVGTIGTDRNAETLREELKRYPDTDRRPAERRPAADQRLHENPRRFLSRSIPGNIPSGYASPLFS